jgi:hypothetical protein
MNARISIAFVVLALPTAIACGKIGENLSVGSDAIEVDGGGASDAGSAASNGEARDQGGYKADSGVLLYETQFEATDECASWTVSGGAVTTVAGQTGSACMLCPSAPETFMSMRKGVAGTPPDGGLGFYQVTYANKLVSMRDPAPSVGAASELWVAGADAGEFLSPGALASTFWSVASAVRNETDDLSAGTFGISVDAITGPSDQLQIGDCLVIDSLRVIYYPASP